MTVATTVSDASTSMTRTIALSAPADAAAVMRMAGGEGILSVRTSSDRTQLQVTYDVRRTGMAALERLAVTAGLLPSTDLLARLSRGWAAFQDDNLRNQAKLVHRCCSNPLDGSA